MKAVRKLFYFLVYSNLFIAGCAVVMTDQTYRLVLNKPVHTDFLFFVLFSTLTSYSFHWYLSAPSVIVSSREIWLKQNRHIHLLLFFIGMTGAAVFFYHLLAHWHWLLVTAFITFLYSAPKIPHPLFRALRKVALGKTIFLAMVWMGVTSLLPILISGQAWTMEFTFFTVSRFFLIYAICILFDYRDRQDDKAAGIRSLITYLDEKGISILFTVSLILFSVSTILLYQFDYTPVSIAILLLPGLITALLYNYARRHFDDLLYYFILDGLMAFSAILFLIAGI